MIFFYACIPLFQLSVCISTVLVTKKPILSLGFDFGTSGVRCIGIDEDSSIAYEDSLKWTADVFKNQKPHEQWITGLHTLLNRINTLETLTIERICLSGTSGSALMYNINQNKVSRPPRMYNFNVYSESPSALSAKVKATLQQYCPPTSPAISPTSTLAKLLLWHEESRLQPNERLAHQADFVEHSLLGSPPRFISEWHNSLKLGFDVKKDEYPDWLLKLLAHLGYTEPKDTLLPSVVKPGSIIGPVSKNYISSYGLSPTCKLVAGTTDSIAAFLAAGVSKPGQAVSSLGSTLAIKLLSTVCVEDAERGIYSHRLGDLWLVGGASNTGCAVLRQQGFTDDDLNRLSNLVDPSTDSGLTYYPLTTVGERFPVNDPKMLPVLDPKPDLSGYSGNRCRDTEWRRLYLHGILEGIARVEQKGYAALGELGATPVTEVLTCGGGARNDMWTAMRQRLLGPSVKCSTATQVEAAFGCALLGLRSL